MRGARSEEQLPSGIKFGVLPPIPHILSSFSRSEFNSLPWQEQGTQGKHHGQGREEVSVYWVILCAVVKRTA